jgi:hypothetical protein
MPRRLLVLVMLLTACSKGGGDSGTAAATGAPPTKSGAHAGTYTIQAPSLDEPRPTIKLTAQIPAGWTEELGKDGAPEFILPDGDSFMRPTLVFLTPRGDDDAARMATTIGLQFDQADLAAAHREDLSNGRVWIAQTRADGHVHARLFIPAPAQQGVVMCVAMLKPELAKQLGKIRAMCETVAIAP